MDPRCRVARRDDLDREVGGTGERPGRVFDLPVAFESHERDVRSADGVRCTGEEKPRIVREHDAETTGSHERTEQARHRRSQLTVPWCRKRLAHQAARFELVQPAVVRYPVKILDRHRLQVRHGVHARKSTSTTEHAAIPPGCLFATIPSAEARPIPDRVKRWSVPHQ